MFGTNGFYLENSNLPFVKQNYSELKCDKKVIHILNEERKYSSYGYCEAILLPNNRINVLKGSWDKNYNFIHNSLYDEFYQALLNVNAFLIKQGVNPKKVNYIAINTMQNFSLKFKFYINTLIKQHYPNSTKLKYNMRNMIGNEKVRLLLDIVAIRA